MQDNIDRRKYKNLKNNVKKAEKRINIKVYAVIEELKKDKDFMQKLDAEIDAIKTQEDLEKYMNNVYNEALEERRRLNDELLKTDENFEQARICARKAGSEAGQVANKIIRSRG